MPQAVATLALLPATHCQRLGQRECFNLPNAVGCEVAQEQVATNEEAERERERGGAGQSSEPQDLCPIGENDFVPLRQKNKINIK